MRPLCFLWFPSGNLLYRPDPLAAHTNVVLVESAETRAATPLAILVIFSISFEWNNTIAFADRAGNVIILKAVSVAGGAAYCEECFIDHDLFKQLRQQISANLIGRSRMDVSSDIFALSNP